MVKSGIATMSGFKCKRTFVLWNKLFENLWPVFAFKDAHKFGEQIRKALDDLLHLLQSNQMGANKTEESQPKGKKEQWMIDDR